MHERERKRERERERERERKRERERETERDQEKKKRYADLARSQSYKIDYAKAKILALVLLRQRIFCNPINLFCAVGTNFYAKICA